MEQAAEDKPAERPAPEKSREERRAEGNLNARIRAAVSESEARVRKTYETELGSLRALVLASEADKLVAQGEFKSRERALEYLTLKSGATAAAQPEAQQQQPRDEHGRFAALPTEETALKAHADMLFGQAQEILEDGGPDMMALYKADPAVKDAVNRGVDFNTIRAILRGNAPASRRAAPQTAKAPNHGVPSAKSILEMTDAEFAKVEEMIRKGYKLRE